MFKAMFLGLTVLLLTSTSTGQSVTLVNKTTSDKNSRILYVGLENYLEIQDANFKGIEPADHVTLQQNLLIIKPGKPGQPTITFLTTGGKVPVNFIVKPLSDAMVAIGNQTGKTVSKDSLLQAEQLSLASADNRDSLFDHYGVVSFTARLNGQVFEITGKDFSNELLTAIRHAQKGDTLFIDTVKGWNEALSMTVKFNKTYSFELE